MNNQQTGLAGWIGASVHGLVGLLRRGGLQSNRTESLEWIENNLEEYLETTTFN